MSEFGSVPGGSSTSKSAKDIAIGVYLDSKGVDKGAKEIEKRTETMASRVTTSLAKVGKSFNENAGPWVLGTVAAGFAGLTAAVITFTKAGVEAEGIERRALAVIGRRGQLTATMREELLAFNLEQQRGLGVSADTLLSLQATGSAIGVSTNKLQDMTRGAIGLSKVMGMDLNSAGDIAAKVFSGKIPKALGQMGLVVRDASDAQRQLLGMFKTAGTMSDTLGVRLDALNESWGDLQETIGLGITQSGNARVGVSALQTLFDDLSDAFASKEGKQAVNDFFGAIVLGAADGLDALLGMYKFLVDFHNKANSLAYDILTNDLVSGFREAVGLEDIRKYQRPKAEGYGAISSYFENFANDLRNRQRAGGGVQAPGEPPGGANFGGVPPIDKEGAKADQDYESRLRQQWVEERLAFGAIKAQIMDEEWQADATRLSRTESLRQKELDVERSAMEKRWALNREFVDAKNAGIAIFGEWKQSIETQLDGLVDLFDGGGISENAIGLLVDFGKMLAGALTDMFTNIGEAIGEGDGNKALAAVGGFFGGLLKTMGQSAIQLGTLIAVMGLVGAFIPGLEGFAAALPFAPALIAGGIAAVAAGTAIQSATGGSGGPSGGAGGGSGGRPTDHARDSRGRAYNTNTSRPFAGLGEGTGYNPNNSAGGNYTYIVNLNGAIGGSPRAVARDIRDVLDREGVLRVGGR